MKIVLIAMSGGRPGVELEYHEVPDVRLVDRLPTCDLAAISTYTAQAKDPYELARRCRCHRRGRAELADVGS
jgi:hypothetical protein